MGRFENTKEYQQSVKMRPACDRVLCYVFKTTPDRIERFDKNKEHEKFALDKFFGVDMVVNLSNGSQVTGQEKCLSWSCYKYQTFTIEFWQNRKTKEPGEFFRIASQFYLHGYADESGEHFIEWKILDTLRFMSWLKQRDIDELDAQCRDSGPSRAAFLPIPYCQIPPEFVLSSWKRGNTKPAIIIANENTQGRLF